MKHFWEKYFPLILILLNIVLTLLIFDPRIFLGGDNITFIILAHSLLNGQGYRDLSNPGTPVFIGSPPGYPAFLMFVMLIFGALTDVVYFKLASLILSCITLYYFYRLLQFSSTNKAFVIISALLLVANLNILYPNHLELSEVLFNTFLLASLYCFMSGCKRGELSGIILAVLATYTRYAGIVLLFALLAYLLLRRKLKEFWLYGLLIIVLILPWALYVIAHGFTLTDIMTGAPYTEERKLITAGELFQRWSQNFQYYFLMAFPQDLFSWQAPPLWISIPFTLLVLLGFYLKSRDKFSSLELFCIFYSVLILSWPQVWKGERYILPIIYFVALYFVYAISRLLKPKLFAVALGLIILYNAYITVGVAPLTYRRLQAWQQGTIYKYYPAEWVKFFGCCNWIRENLPREAVIVSRKPNIVYFQTGNRGFVYPFSLKIEEVYQKIKQADYILVDNFEWSKSTQNYLLPALYQHQQDFQLAFQIPEGNFFVLRVKK